MRVAVRRTTRVKGQSGAVLEDLGVEPDIRHRMTRRDVMSRNEDLIDRALAVLEAGTVHAIDVAGIEPHRDRAPTLKLTTVNVDRIGGDIDGAVLASCPTRAGRATIELGEAVAVNASGSVAVRLLGYRGGDLVAERRILVEVD